MLPFACYLAAAILCLANLTFDQTFAWEAVAGLIATGLALSAIGWGVPWKR